MHTYPHVRLTGPLRTTYRAALGKFVVVVDNEDRENEGDLIMAADAMTTERMAFLIRYTRSARTRARA
jgi:3,4-dihydroxy-2-butanone 4-phosphate synthase